MKLTWYGHACFRLETAEGSIVFDPYAPGSVPGLELPKLAADAVSCSHGHADHSAADAVELTGRTPSWELRTVASFHDDQQGTLRGANLITVVETEGLRVVHLGDLGHELSTQQLAAIGTPDVLMVPVGGHYTIDGKTAAKTAKALGAKTVIPMHYRGEGFGYGVIGPVDAFLGEFGRVRFAETNELTVEDPAGNEAVVLRCPVK